MRYFPTFSGDQATSARWGRLISLDLKRKAQAPQPNSQIDEEGVLTLDTPQSRFARFRDAVATKSSQAVQNLKSVISNPRAVAKAVFTKQNMGEMALSAAVMATAKATVLATTAVVSAPVVAVYAATVATGGLVGGSLRTWREWRKSRQEAQEVVNQRAQEEASPDADTDTKLTDKFTFAAQQGYWDYAFEEKRLLKNVAKSAFTTAAGGAIGVAAHGLFETLQHGFGVQEAKTALAGAPVTAAPQEMMPSQQEMMSSQDTLPMAQTEAPQTEVPRQSPVVTVSDTAKTGAVHFAEPETTSVSDASADNVDQAFAQDDASLVAPENAPGADINATDAPVGSNAQGPDAANASEPFIIGEETLPQQDAADLSGVTDNSGVDLPVDDTAQEVTENLPAQEIPAPIAPAAPLLPQDVAAQCMVGGDNQTINCIARDTGNIRTGEKLRMLFGAAKTPVDFVNGGPTTDAPSFIQSLRNFTPFQDWLRTSAPAPAQPAVN